MSEHQLAAAAGVVDAKGSAHLLRHNSAFVNLVRHHATEQGGDSAVDGGTASPSLSHSGSLASERGHSPFPHTPIASEYADSAVEESQPAADKYISGDVYDTKMEGDVYGAHVEEDDLIDEDAEEDLSSEPPQQRSEGEWERIEDEIRVMTSGVEGMTQYEVVDKLGEGTFSSVYKAIDKNHFLYDNYLWTGKLPGPPPPIHSRPSKRSKSNNVYVALKRIYVTSSPQRILNELEIMEELRDCPNIAFLITAFRTEDQIIAVMPYSRHTDFREYYRIMPLGDLKCYFRCLFSALQGAHDCHIMHRDVKPANFLYDPRTGEGTLCDFGLAERFDAQEWRGKCHHTCPTAEHPFGRVHLNKTVYSTHLEPGGALHEGAKAITTGAASAAVTAAANAGVGNISAASGSSSMARNKAMGPPERVGVLKEDGRQAVRANRAGTRGFRAPEVLFKCQDQTTSLDIWSAGIILMAFLTKRFPLFNSNDDTEALLELTIIFGRRRMTQTALLHNRTFHCNVPMERAEGWRVPEFILRLNPDILTVPVGHPDPHQYAAEVELAMDLCRMCLQLDPTKRCTAREALKHPFLLSKPTSSSSRSSSSSSPPLSHHEQAVKR